MILSIFDETIKNDLFNYSQVTESHIAYGLKSLVPIRCKHCDHNWNPTIDNHIYRQTGCPECSNSVRWDLQRFLMKSHEIHGDKYDYSEVTEDHIQNNKSHVPIRCRTCTYRWSPTIHSHINEKHGCLDCAGKAPLTLERFIYKAKKIHENNYDYSEIREDHMINGARSRVPISCHICRHKWNPEAGKHIYGSQPSGCPSCSGHLRWTRQLFLDRAQIVHGDRYDYSEIKEEDIIGRDSHAPIGCKTCQYRWCPPISAHIYGPTGCPECAGRAPFTYEKFTRVAPIIHGNKFDYSKVRPEHINSIRSNVPVHCNECGHDWDPTIINHIYNGSGCPKCAGKLEWSYERLISDGRQIHGDKYDYSAIQPYHIESIRSHIPVRCVKCDKYWSPTIHDHIHCQSGCPRCIKSKGEEFILTLLREITAESIEPQYRHSDAIGYRYDFRFQYHGIWYKLEYDGRQHFTDIPFFNQNSTLEYRQLRDRIKSVIAGNDGDERFIRIDYTFNTKEKIKDFLLRALNSDDKFVLSTPEMYMWLYEPVSLEQLQQYVPNWCQKMNLS